MGMRSDAPVVHVGMSTTKGEPDGAPPRVRTAEFLGRTLAHELGHALTLMHTRRRAFSDGTPCNHSGRPNVMEGGTDAKGGAGVALELWQILAARAAARRLARIRAAAQ